MTTAPGRPRDRRIDSAVLAATAELLVEVGYADLTIAAVADRARTTKPAIYRRWRSKAHLVHEAAFPTDADRVQVPSTGSLDTDLRAMVRACVDVFAHPVARAAVPGLIAEFAADRTLHAALVERLADGPLGTARDRLAGAATDPDAVIEAMAGTTLLALLFRGGDDLDDAWIDRTTTLLLKGIAP
ncbi:TetR family transcriptional regulator [Nocardioides sp. Root1257]|nr:TetR family transcriptional regulator [Nocardioides sp. Root1257]KRC56266.1 TetR family transcriptional regulator [Nocardioides sp. Root224]